MGKNVIVVGMPRSGTSLAASIFAKQGYFSAEDQHKELRMADEYNPTGYWEAEAITRGNAEVFSKVGFHHDNTWLFDAMTSAQAKAINDVVPSVEHKRLIETYNRNSPWVLKDPRFCYTIGYWWSVVDQDSTRVLLVRRDPKQILHSFLRLKWRKDCASEREDVLQRIEQHISAAEYAIKKFNIPHLSINYDDYAKLPEQTACLINEFFDLNLKPDDLGYTPSYNNSTYRGRLETRLRRLVDKMPRSWVKFARNILPKFLIKRLFPTKY